MSVSTVSQSWAGSAAAERRPRMIGIVGAVQVACAAALAVLVLALLAVTLPSLVGDESFIVLSGSMVPSINIGDIAVVQPVPVDQLKIGDVVTYRTPEQPNVLVTHRLVAIQHPEAGRTVFETKGDANATPDAVPVDTNAVLGRVMLRVPSVGYVAKFARTPLGLLLLIIMPALLLAGDYLRARLRRRAGGAAGRTGVDERRASAEAARVGTLLARGRDALAGGRSDLAVGAANRVLQSDPRNQEAWLLKAEATVERTDRRALLQTALTLNPRSEAIRAALLASESERSAA